MKEHIHRPIEKDRKDGLAIAIAGMALTILSLISFVLEYVQYGMAFVSLAIMCWVLFLGMIIKVQARYGRILLANIHNRSEYDHCKICNPITEEKK